MPNGVSTTLPKDADLIPAYENEALLNTAEYKKYRSLTGSLLYQAVCTHPEISLPVGTLQTLAMKIDRVCANCRQHRQLCCASAYHEQANFCQNQTHRP